MSYGIGIVGTGYMARRHCAALTENEAARLEVVCSTPRSARVGEEFRGTYGFRRATTSFDDLVADPAVDIVLVCSPDGAHPDHVVRALDGGKHVLCEKPLARSEAEFDAVRRALEATGKTLQVGMNCRFRPQFAAIRELAETEALGTVRFIRGTYVQNAVALVRGRQKPWALDVHGEANQYLHGGGLHCLDVMRWIAGDVVSVFARAAAHELADEWRLDAFSASLELDGGVLGELLVSAAAFRPNSFGIELWCSGGSVVDGVVYRRRGDELSDDAEPLGTAQDVPDVRLELDDLVRAIETGTQPLNSFAEAYANFAVLHAIERSLTEGAPVAVERPVAAGRPG